MYAVVPESMQAFSGGLFGLHQLCGICILSSFYATVPRMQSSYNDYGWDVDLLQLLTVDHLWNMNQTRRGGARARCSIPERSDGALQEEMSRWIKQEAGSSLRDHGDLLYNNKLPFHLYHPHLRRPPLIRSFWSRSTTTVCSLHTQRVCPHVWESCLVQMCEEKNQNESGDADVFKHLWHTKTEVNHTFCLLSTAQTKCKVQEDVMNISALKTQGQTTGKSHK